MMRQYYAQRYRGGGDNPLGVGVIAVGSIYYIQENYYFDNWPKVTKRPDLTGKRTKLEQAGIAFQVEQRVERVQWPKRARLVMTGIT